jgi:hypothetical protein
MQNAPHRAIKDDNAGGEGVIERLLTKSSIVHVQVKPAWNHILPFLPRFADPLEAVVTHVQARWTGGHFHTVTFSNTSRITVSHG